MNTEEKKIDISAVIPTIGEKSLHKLIGNLNSGTVIPKEIILIYPPNEKKTLNENSYDNLRIMNSLKKGQVAQRYWGIKNTNYDLILQLDADISMKKNTLEELLKAYNLKGPKVAVGAKVKIINSKKKQSVAGDKLKKVFNFIGGGNINIVDKKKEFRFDHWFVNYSQPLKSQFVNLIPGGCILFNKKYYENFDYYPLNGHAIGEDLINSLYLRKYGNNLFFQKTAEVYQPKSTGYDHHNTKELYIFLVKIFKIKKHICKIAKGNIFRYYIWYIYFVVVSITKFIIHKK